MLSKRDTIEGLQSLPKAITDRNGEEVAVISTYQDVVADQACIARNIARLRAGFPKMQDAFFSLLIERVIARRFTAQRLEDAVNNTLDNFHYKELTVADIVSFDRVERLYTYTQKARMVVKGIADWNDFALWKPSLEMESRMYYMKSDAPFFLKAD